ncbi:MAG: hypothetical protein J6U98_04050 [Abditibacteriota bacterium]|nr:hypothetical protein [Abditibacteriota bacterium]
MKRIIAVIILALFAAAAHCAGAEDWLLKSDKFSRSVSHSVGFLKTAKITYDRYQMLGAASPEFVIDVKNKDGDPVFLTPGDFKALDVKDEGGESGMKRTYTLVSHKDGYPITVSLVYTSSPTGEYITKHMNVIPTKKAADVIVSGITLESLTMKPSLAQVAAASIFDGIDLGEDINPENAPFVLRGVSYIGGLDLKAKKGFYFIYNTRTSKSRAFYNRRNEIMVWEDVNQPATVGYTSGTVIIGALECDNPQALYERSRAVFAETVLPRLTGAKEFKSLNLTKPRFVPVVEPVSVSCDAFITENGGYLVFFNPTGDKLTVHGVTDERFIKNSKNLTAEGLDIASGKIEAELEPASVKIIPVKVKE